MELQGNKIIQQYAAILEYGKCSVRSTAAIQFSIDEVKEALVAEWCATKIREDKDAAWKSESVAALENGYLHMALFVPQEDYETVELFETLGQGIDRSSTPDAKKQEDARTLVELTPKYTRIQGDVTAKMEKFKNELQNLKNAQEFVNTATSTPSKSERPWWKIW